MIFDNFFGQNQNILSSVRNAVKNPTVGRNLWLLFTDGLLPSVETVYLNPQWSSAPAVRHSRRLRVNSVVDGWDGVGWDYPLQGAFDREGK